MRRFLTLTLLCAAVFGSAVPSGALAQSSVPAAPTPAPAPVTPAPVTPAPTTPAPAAPAPAAPAPRAPAANYVVVGNLYYDQGKFDQAYVAFRTAAELDPGNAQALLGLGRSQVRLRLYAPALDTLRRLTTVDPQNVSGYVALSQAYQQQFIGSGNRAGVAGNLDAALTALQQADRAVTALPEADRPLAQSKLFNERGNIYRLQGKPAQAIDAFRQASTLNPDNSLILFNLGDMYAATGQLPLAISALQQAVILDPRDPYNRAYYAKLLALSGNLTSARMEAAQAARLVPGNAYATGQYGVVSYLAGDRAGARTQLAQAVRLDPLRYPEFYYYLGRLDLDSSDLKAARDNLTRAVALSSGSAEYAYYLGLSYERGVPGVAPDHLKARENYEKALKLAPGYKQAQEGVDRLKPATSGN